MPNPNIILPHIQEQINQGYRIVDPQFLQVDREYVLRTRSQRYSYFFFRLPYIGATPTGYIFMRAEGPRVFSSDTWIFFEKIPPINEDPAPHGNIPIVINNENEDPGQIGGRRRRGRKSRKSIQRKCKTQKRKYRK